MTHFSLGRSLLLTLLWLLVGPAARAQAPAWRDVWHLDDYDGLVSPVATATDAVGNVYMAGTFWGRTRIGYVQLINDGNSEAFVAKWSAASHRIVWALSMGGQHSDATTLVVKGASVYVAGSFSGATEGFDHLLTPIGDDDAYVTKLTDHGTRATFEWTRQFGYPQTQTTAHHLATSGNTLYVAGTSYSRRDSLDPRTQGMVARTTDYLTKLTDTGPAAHVGWTRTVKTEQGHYSLDALVAQGSQVYLATNIWHDTPASTKPIPAGASGLPYFRARYTLQITQLTDTGASYHLGWTWQDAGCVTSLAVTGATLYLVGCADDRTPFGHLGQPAHERDVEGDMFVAKLVAADTAAHLGWVQRLRGSGYNEENLLSHVVVRGARVYLAGTFGSHLLQFGGVKLVSPNTGRGRDLLVVQMTDAGPTARFDWAQRAAGPAYNNLVDLALVGHRLYLSGLLQDSPVAVGAQELKMLPGKNDSYFRASLPLTK